MTTFVIIVIGYLTYTLNGPVYTTAHTVSIKILKKVYLYNIQLDLRWNSANKCSLNRNNVR